MLQNIKTKGRFETPPQELEKSWRFRIEKMSRVFRDLEIDPNTPYLGEINYWEIDQDPSKVYNEISERMEPLVQLNYARVQLCTPNQVGLVLVGDLAFYLQGRNRIFTFANR